jgi:hypothetical protein
LRLRSDALARRSAPRGASATIVAPRGRRSPPPVRASRRVAGRIDCSPVRQLAATRYLIRRTVLRHRDFDHSTSIVMGPLFLAVFVDYRCRWMMCSRCRAKPMLASFCGSQRDAPRWSRSPIGCRRSARYAPSDAHRRARSPKFFNDQHAVSSLSFQFRSLNGRLSRQRHRVMRATLRDDRSVRRSLSAIPRVTTRANRPWVSNCQFSR